MTAPHDRPTAIELVDAVRELLTDELLDAVDGRLRFQVRVAANALAMVGRELELGDDRWDELTTAVRASVVDKLAVSNPTYTTTD